MSNPVVPKPTPAEMSAFLSSLRKTVVDEATTQRQQVLQVWKKPLPVRVSEGQAIEGVQILDIREKEGLLELACPQNDSLFREGDILCLNQGNPQAYPFFMVNLKEDNDQRLLVSFGPGTNIGELSRQRTGWILDVGYLDLSAYILEALAEAGDSLAGRERILPLLMGKAQSQINPHLYERGLNLGETFGLNWSQREALAQSYATDLVHLIQGPPGTGKTRVLAHLAQALVRDGERVLVTAFTHRAINNALNKLAEVDPHLPVTKIGPQRRADDLRAPNCESFNASPLANESGGYVIGTTTFALRTGRASGVEFETVIFDEASQITVSLAIMGMLQAKKYIFVGDEKQLPPVIITRQAGGFARQSVFSALAGRGQETLLTETYRMNEALTTWPSEEFYEGMLVCAPGVANRRLDLPRPPARYLDILDPDEPRLFWDMAHRNTTTRSHREAQAVVGLIQSLLACGFPPQEIGVVTPYRAQGREIRSLLRQIVPEELIRRLIVVDTVERMQGQERDIVIVSLTTSSPAFATQLADFFFQPERLNVAITRPRSKLIIIGSHHVLMAQPMGREQQEAVERLARLLNSCAIVPYNDF